MKQRSKVIGAVLLTIVAIIFCHRMIVFATGAYYLVTASNEVYVAFHNLQVGDEKVEFYANYTYDSGVLGFSITDGSGERHYYPMYGSTYRGIPLVELDVFLSKSQDQMWVRWSGSNQVIGYYRAGSDKSTVSYDEATPPSFGLDSTRFPKMDPQLVEPARSIAYDEKLAERFYDGTKGFQRIDLINR